MADLILIYTKKTENKFEKNVEMIGRLTDQAEQLLQAPVRDILAIRTLAMEMVSVGLVKGGKKLLEQIGENLS